MKTIAIIGTGIMGNGIAKNFLKHGYTVFVWNRSQEKTKALTKLGALVCKTPKKAAEKSNIVFEVTANDKSSKSVWLGKNGILAGANSTKILITCATLSINWIDTLIKRCAIENLTFFDMPMTGGRKGAESGALTLLVGGDNNKLNQLKTELQNISQKVIYFGKAGSGMRYKLLLNTLQAIHIQGLGEVLHLAKHLHMDLNTVGNSLADRPGGTTTNLAWRDFQQNPDPINFSIEWITKDLKYAKKIASKTKTPLLNQVLNKYKTAMNLKYAQEDWTFVNKLED